MIGKSNRLSRPPTLSNWSESRRGVSGVGCSSLGAPCCVEGNRSLQGKIVSGSVGGRRVQLRAVPQWIGED